MKITILGSGSATPMLDRKPTSIVVENQSDIFLIDCGEGTQWQMISYGIKQSKINHIFISHLHGDHFLGLIGLISTFHSYNRNTPLHIYAPIGLKEIITLQFKYQQTSLEYELYIHEINVETKTLILETKKSKVFAYPLKHRIPTFGYEIAQIPQPYNIIKEKLPSNIKLAHIQMLKLGQDVYDEQGKILYKVNEYTKAPLPVKRFAFCSDTIFDASIVPYIEGVDLLYHESTFLEENKDRAAVTFHSTAIQAGTIAKQSSAKKLVIGHFSARYKDIEPFLLEAKTVFENTILAKDGLEIVI
jgi:ribonuclease Z